MRAGQLIVLGLIAIVGIVGCAGGPQAVSINTRPAGALVIINGEEKGYTPLEVMLQGSRSYRLQVEKPGYETFRRTLAERMATEQYGPLFQVMGSRLESTVNVDLRPLP